MEKEISYNVDIVCVSQSIKLKLQSKQSEWIHIVFQGNEQSVLIETDNAPALGTARRKPTYPDPLAYIARKARYKYCIWETSERAFFAKKRWSSEKAYHEYKINFIARSFSHKP